MLRCGARDRVKDRSLAHAIEPERSIAQRGLFEIVEIPFGPRRTLETAVAKRFTSEARVSRVRYSSACGAHMPKRTHTNPDRETNDEASRVEIAMPGPASDNPLDQASTSFHRPSFAKARLTWMLRRFAPALVRPAMGEKMAVTSHSSARDAEAATTAPDRHLAIAYRRAVGLAS